MGWKRERAETALRRARDFLEQEEATHGLILNLLERLERRDQLVGDSGGTMRLGAADAIVALEEDDTAGVRGVLLRTPPFKFTMSRMSLDVAQAAGEFLLREGVSFPGVLGPADEARALADVMARALGRPVHVERSERVHALTAVAQLNRPSGHARPAGPADAHVLRTWVEAFVSETGVQRSSAEQELAELLDAGGLFLWQDGAAVAMANYGGTTRNGRGINWVYTPPPRRRRGYATALVAELSERALLGGKAFAYLFTDLDNPVSNAIYRKIGYKPVRDMLTLRL